MQVETFECQETASEPIEATEEAIGIIDSLELEGQRKLIAPDKSSDESAGSEQRCPYRKIRKDEALVYGQLCPQKTALVDYDFSPIPLRVLQIAAHAKGLGMFEKFEVWSAQGQIKDPVLVAYETDQWNAVPFILARWGEVLDEWAILVANAVAICKDTLRASLQKIQRQVQGDLAGVETLTLASLLRKDDVTYYGLAD